MSNSVIPVLLSTGVTIPFRALQAGNGNEYHAVLDPKTGKQPKSRSGGVPVAPSVVGGELPVWAEVLGVRVPLAPGKSEYDVPQVTAKRVPITYEGEPRLFTIKIGRGKSFRVSGSINRPGGAGKVTEQSSL